MAKRGNVPRAGFVKTLPQTHIPSSAGGLTYLYRCVIFSDYVSPAVQGEGAEERETLVEERGGESGGYNEKRTEGEKIARGGGTKRIPGATRVPLERRPLEISCTLYTQKLVLNHGDSNRLAWFTFLLRIHAVPPLNGRRRAESRIIDSFFCF